MIERIYEKKTLYKRMKFYIISLNKFNTLFNFIQILIHKIYLLSLNLIILINYKVVLLNLSLLT